MSVKVALARISSIFFYCNLALVSLELMDRAGFIPPGLDPTVAIISFDIHPHDSNQQVLI